MPSPTKACVALVMLFFCGCSVRPVKLGGVLRLDAEGTPRPAEVLQGEKRPEYEYYTPAVPFGEEQGTEFSGFHYVRVPGTGIVSAEFGVVFGEAGVVAVGVSSDSRPSEFSVALVREDGVSWEIQIAVGSQPIRGLQVQAGGGRCFVLSVGSVTARITAFDLHSGGLLWSKEVGTTCEIAYVGEDYDRALVCVTRLLVEPGSGVDVFEPATGETRSSFDGAHTYELTRIGGGLLLVPTEEYSYRRMWVDRICAAEAEEVLRLPWQERRPR